MNSKAHEEKIAELKRLHAFSDQEAEFMLALENGDIDGDIVELSDNKRTKESDI